MGLDSALFPPFPPSLKGRRAELVALAAIVAGAEPSRLALVGAGGSGKSVLACALGHRVRRRFPGGTDWFRCGPWDVATLTEMLSIRYGTSRERAARFPSLRAFLSSRGRSLVVLDNHENDRAIAVLLNELRDTPVSWVITARRCLLSGVLVFPVVAPRSTGDGGAFARVRSLARLLRHSPLALDIADALVASRASGVDELRAWLLERGVDRIRVVAHEDDLPEVALLVDWAWARLEAPARRALAVLAHLGGDHVDAESLGVLAKLGTRAAAARVLARLRAWRLVQCPFADRYAVHAVVRYALQRRTRFSQERLLRYYLGLLERAPERLDLEQTHLYAAMDCAHSASNLDWMLRIDRLLSSLS
jgi:hypothetical protein